MSQLKNDFTTLGFARLPQRLSEATLIELQQSVLLGFGGHVPGTRGNMWGYSGYVRALATATPFMAAGDELFGAKLRPYCSETFALGPELPYHAAGMWLYSLTAPEQGCCIWTALQDMTPDNGPLVVFPGTHHFALPSMAELGGVGTTYLPVYYVHAAQSVRLRAPLYMYLAAGESVVLHPRLIQGTARRRHPGAPCLSHRTWYGTHGDHAYIVPVESDLARGVVAPAVFPDL